MKGRTSLYVISLLFASCDKTTAHKLNWKYGLAEKERDADSGYPETDHYSKDDHDWAKDFVDPASGRTKFAYEVA